MNHFKKLYYKFKIYSNLKNEIIQLPNNKPRCLIFLAADYGNLGDVAITLAQKQYLSSHFPNYNVIEIPASKTLTTLKSIKSQINNNDIITIVGGGNMGNIYGDIELLRLIIVKSFPANRIILFPQTIYYNKDKDGEWLKRLSQKIYRDHKRLTMTARERISYNTMKELYPDVDVRLTPDIVMGLNMRSNESRNDIAIFCLRDDLESKDNDSAIIELEKLCHKIGLQRTDHDTHIGNGRYNENEKYNKLKALLNHFKKSKLIITDRLHGMIFAYITGTPAIVLPNNNFKIHACHKWLNKSTGIVLYNKKNTKHLENLLSLKISEDSDLISSLNRIIE